MSEQQNNEKKVYYIPMEITKEDAAAMGLNPTEVKLWRFCGQLVPCLMVPVENEDVYNSVLNTLKNEKKQTERDNRCKLLSKRYHQYSLCQGNCRECEYYDQRGHISLDEFQEENEYELTDGITAEDTILNDVFQRDITDCIRLMSKDEQLIARAILDHVPDKTVMKLLGIEKQSTYSSRKMKVRKKLQEAMEAWL